MMKMSVARKEDLKEIVEIYNWAIEKTTATFDTQKKTVESQMDWFNQHDENYPLIVVKEETKVIAWGSISSWSDRCAYSGTGEVSFYVHPAHHG